MRIFADFHHSGLYASFIHTLEGRLGHELVRPIGKEWFDEGYWKIAEPYKNNPATVSQYLDIGSQPNDGTPPLNEPTTFDGFVGMYHAGEEVMHKVITFNQFKNTQIDVVIASIPGHIQPYKKLIQEYQPDAKLIYHIGNIGWHEEIPWKQVDNLMASVKQFDVPEGKNVVFYRQEFDLDIFKPAEEYIEAIGSFVHPSYKSIYMAELAEHMGLDLRDYGYSLNGIRNIANAMKSCKYAYHSKPGGDGFGHLIHNWAAVGKPMFVNLDDYKDKLAGEFLVDMGTCIDISKRTPKEAAEAMLSLDYNDTVENIKKEFAHAVDFEKDSVKVQEFLNDLQ